MCELAVGRYARQSTAEYTLLTGGFLHVAMSRILHGEAEGMDNASSLKELIYCTARNLQRLACETAVQ